MQLLFDANVDINMDVDTEDDWVCSFDFGLYSVSCMVFVWCVLQRGTKSTIK